MFGAVRGDNPDTGVSLGPHEAVRRPGRPVRRRPAQGLRAQRPAGLPRVGRAATRLAPRGCRLGSASWRSGTWRSSAADRPAFRRVRGGPARGAHAGPGEGRAPALQDLRRRADRHLHRRVADRIAIPAADRIDRATFTRDGRRAFTRTAAAGRCWRWCAAASSTTRCGPRRRRRARRCGRASARAGDRADAGRRTAALADGSEVHRGGRDRRRRLVRVTARHVGVDYSQVDLGLEVELPVPAARRAVAGPGAPRLGAASRLVRLGLPEGRRAHRRRDRRARQWRADPGVPAATSSPGSASTASSPCTTPGT